MNNMIKLNVRCVNFLLERSNTFSSLSDIAGQLDVPESDLEECINELLVSSIVEAKKVDEVSNYRYLYPIDISLII